ncbi:MAG: DegQ family serine endoprotease [Nitrospirae bacterium]|nr:DegQ family serine endoprotease [Nitrospirota bacterium]
MHILKKFNKKGIVVGVILISIGVIVGVVISSNLGWIPLGQAKVEPIPPKITEQLAETGKAFVEIARRVTPAVVNISTTKIAKGLEKSPLSPFFQDPLFRRFFGDEFFREHEMPRRRKEQSLGSGVIVSEDGYIITNNHVVEGADEIKVVLSDKREFIGKVVGADPKTDLSIIKIKAGDLPAIVWGDSDRIEVGEFVLAIGSPFGLNQTVTSGIISAKGRANVGIADYEDFIQTDAAINPGNSGGALVNVRGELIGINTAIFTRSGGYMGIGFAVPSNMAKAVMDSLVKEGKVTRGWLGVYIQDITPDLAKQFKLGTNIGALVSDVIEGSPAEKAGLERGDVIVQYNGKEVENNGHLRNMVAQTPVGKVVDVRIIREGREKVLKVTIGELPAEVAKGEKGEEDTGGIFKGVTVQNLTPEFRERLDIPDKIKGVIIAAIEGGSAGEEYGLRSGDVILEINKKATKTVKDFNKAIGEIKKDESILVLVYREGMTIYITLSLIQ